MFRMEIQLKPENDSGQEGFPVSKVFIKRSLQSTYLVGTLDQVLLHDWNGHVLRRFSSENLQVPELFSPPLYNSRYLTVLQIDLLLVKMK